MKLAPLVLMVTALGVLACDLHATLHTPDAQSSVEEKTPPEAPAGSDSATSPARASEPAQKQKAPNKGNQPPTKAKPPVAEDSEPPAEDTEPPAEDTEPPVENTDTPAEDTEPPAEDICTLDGDWLTLPVRVHRLSSDVENLNGTLSNDTLVAHMAHVNELWAQACIRFEIESIVDTTALPAGEEVFEAAIATPKPGGVAKALATLIAPEDLLDWGWNVVIIRDFGVGAAGYYQSSIDAAFFAQGKYPQKPTHPTILAHELGHSLSLPHYDGEGVEVNMMHAGGGGVVEESIELTVEQVDAARAQAVTGDSF